MHISATDSNLRQRRASPSLKSLHLLVQPRSVEHWISRRQRRWKEKRYAIEGNIVLIIPCGLVDFPTWSHPLDYRAADTKSRDARRREEDEIKHYGM